jgi:hypothetical protein
MPVNPALTSPELASLLKQATTPAKLSYWPDTELAHATINGAPSYPCRTITVSGASAGWVGDHTGRTIKITSADGLTLRGYYCCSDTPGSTRMLVDEITGNGDGGLFNQGIRTIGISSGDRIAILDRYDISAIKPYTASDGTLYQGSSAVGDYNTYPEDMVTITINAEPGDYVTQVHSGTVHIKAVATVNKWPTSFGSTVGFAWTPPAGYTNLTGNTTDTCEFDLPSGAAYYLHLNVTDSIGHTTQCSRGINLHNDSYLPIAIKVPTGDVRNQTGRKCKVIGPQAILAGIPPCATVVVWGANDWGGDDVPTATKKFCGYMINQPFHHEPDYYESSADVVGPFGILEMLDGYGITLLYTGTMLLWTELASSLSTVQFVMWWLLRWRVRNILRRYDYTPLSTGNLTGRRKEFVIGPGKISAQLQGLAARYDSNIGARSDGGIIHKKLPWMDVNRAGNVMRDALNNSIYATIDVQWGKRKSLKPIQLEGYYSDLGSDTAVIAAAPGEAPEPSKTSDKIFDDSTDAKKRAGYTWAWANNEYTKITVYIPVNRDAYEPADLERVPVTVPADKSPTGAEITIMCIPNQVEKIWLGGNRAALKVDLDYETDGVEGVIIPPSTQAVIETPYNTPADLSPVTDAFGGETNFGPSQIFALDTSGHAYRVDISDPSAPVITDISPDDTTRATLGNGLMAIADPWSYGDAVCSFANGIARLNGFWTATPYPAASWSIKYNLRSDVSHTYAMYSLIRGSINRPGYYAWLEHVEHLPDLDRWMEYCYTTDNFATIHYIYLGFDNTDHRRIGLALGCFNTDSYGLVVVFNPTLRSGTDSRDQAILVSTDWGQTFQRVVPTGWDMGNWGATTDDGIVATSYNKIGGGEDRTNQNIWFTWYGQSGIIDPAGNVLYYQSGGSGSVPLNTDQGFNIFTLDAGIKYALEEFHLRKSTDGFTFSEVYDFGSAPNCINGWPTNPNWLCIALGQNVLISFDGGSSYPISIGLPDSVVTAWANLAEIYSSGIHPSV